MSSEQSIQEILDQLETEETPKSLQEKPEAHVIDFEASKQRVSERVKNLQERFGQDAERIKDHVQDLSEAEQKAVIRAFSYATKELKGELLFLEEYAQKVSQETPPVFLETEECTQEEKWGIVDQAFAYLRDKIPSQGTLVASGALYLHGKQMRQQEQNIDGIEKVFLHPPGDLDFVYPDRESIMRARERFANIPGVHFDHEGEIRRFPNGSLIFSGTIDIPVHIGEEERFMPYEFECFEKSSLVISEEILRLKTTIEGFSVLTLEGLTKQYQNNLELERRVKRETTLVMEHLLNPTERFRLQTALSRGEDIQVYDLSSQELRTFYEQVKDQEQAKNDEEKETIQRKQIALLSGGLKEKMYRRKENLEALQKTRQSSLSSSENVSPPEYQHQMAS